MTSSSKSTTTSKTSDAASDESVSLPVLEEAHEKGFLGVETDQRDNDDYTVQGSIKRAKDGGADVTALASPEAPSS